MAFIICELKTKTVRILLQTAVKCQPQVPEYLSYTPWSFILPPYPLQTTSIFCSGVWSTNISLGWCCWGNKLRVAGISWTSVMTQGGVRKYFSQQLDLIFIYYFVISPRKTCGLKWDEQFTFSVAQEAWWTELSRRICHYSHLVF